MPTAFAHAKRLDWDGQRPTAEFFRLLARLVPDGGDGTVLLAPGPQMRVWEEFFAVTWPRLRLVVVHDEDDDSEAHVRMTIAGPFDLVVQAADVSGVAQARLFQRVFMHLRAGGSYLTPNLVPIRSEDIELARIADAAEPLQREDGPREPPYLGDLWDMIQTAQAARIRDFEDHLDVGLAFRDVRGLGRDLKQVHALSKILHIVKGGTSCPKLSETEVGPVLEARPEIGREVEALAAATLVAPVPAIHNLTPADPYALSRVHAPRMVLRQYRDPICSRGQVVTSHGILLPDSFRFPLSRRMTNIYVEESAPRFGSVRRDVSQAEPLPGVWFHLDSEWPGQFGHMLTERLSRMWAWERVKQRHPEAKVLLTPHDRAPFELHQFERDLFEAIGIAPDDVHQFEEPCRPEVLYSATPMFSLSDYVHPEIADVWRQVGDRLAARAGDGVRPERLFLTRPASLKRACQNTHVVEELFEHHGFVVVRPEEHALGEQVAMVRAADAVGGFAGSGLFTTALSPSPTDVFTVGPASYTARNEQLVAAVLGHRVVATWSTPDILQPEEGWTQEAFFSSFTFDPDQEGRFLSDQLSRLPRRL